MGQNPGQNTRENFSGEVFPSGNAPPEGYIEKRARYAAAIRIWRESGKAYAFNKPHGPSRGISAEEAGEIEALGYETRFLSPCENPRRTPMDARARKFAEGEVECQWCGERDDSHLLFSFDCSKCCHSVAHHLPTKESLRAFSESLGALIDFAKAGNTDQAFLTSCGISSEPEPGA